MMWIKERRERGEGQKQGGGEGGRGLGKVVVARKRRIFNRHASFEFFVEKKRRKRVASKEKGIVTDTGINWTKIHFKIT